jgi:ectoine hydroxylase-related dioxygenase (phytanoyl-CoA dioxygenase family)
MRLTDEEIENGELTEEHFTEAVMELKVRGFCAFENLMPETWTQQLRDAFLPTLNDFAAENPPNRGPNRYGVLLPFQKPFAEPWVVANPIVMKILRQLLGEQVICTFFTSDNAMPGSYLQHPHSDADPLYPGQDVAVPPFAYMVNVYIVDSTEQNGPVEIWPYGTHLISDPQVYAEHNRFVDIDARRASALGRFSESIPGQRVVLPAGAVTIRDTRMWHRGTVNETDQPRPMLGFICNRPWYTHAADAHVHIPRADYESLAPEVQELFKNAVIE